MPLRVKRVYEEPAPDDGFRILVDRLWPRGISREKARVDLWLRDIAPSDALRKWFAHDPEKWPEFRRRYLAELADTPELVATIRDRAREGTVTLVFAARDEQHNQAVALRDHIGNG